MGAAIVVSRVSVLNDDTDQGQNSPHRQQALVCSMGGPEVRMAYDHGTHARQHRLRTAKTLTTSLQFRKLVGADGLNDIKKSTLQKVSKRCPADTQSAY